VIDLLMNVFCMRLVGWSASWLITHSYINICFLVWFQLLLDSEEEKAGDQPQKCLVTPENTQKSKKKGKQNPRQEAKLNRFVEKETFEEVHTDLSNF
jgi:hypothetical protein